LLNSSSLSVQNVAKVVLNEYLEPLEVSQLLTIASSSPFCSKFRKYFSESGVVFEELFFEVINRVSQVEPRFTFAYLLDDLDHLKDFPDEFQETRSLTKALVRGAYQKFSSRVRRLSRLCADKTTLYQTITGFQPSIGRHFVAFHTISTTDPEEPVRLLIYLAGTSENVTEFINDDPVIESLVGHQVIVLSKGYENEFEMIKAKIDERIEGAFKGYKYFDQAWNEIKAVPIDTAQSLRSFYRNYVTAVLEVYEKYFKEQPENSFEGNARNLVEAQCRQKWQSYLNQKAYTLSSASTTTKVATHNFDCCVELLHNGVLAARAYGEAKNYELVSGHLQLFSKWLEDANFRPHKIDGNPPELAFMIAPSCPSLLQRKLELKNIQFIPSPKVPSVKPPAPNPTKKSSVNVNADDKNSLIKVFKGARIKEKIGLFRICG